LIDYCLTFGEQYFSYIQDENKLINICKLYVAMRDEMGQTGQRRLTPLKKYGELGTDKKVV